ncbi:hypothetical protein [Burkholderia sp. Ed8]|uniref:hypothetical protein n=1 Tax=Burkholderia sp. Ed8 TaxID=3112957 RepID=UPI00345CD73A
MKIGILIGRLFWECCAKCFLIRSKMVAATYASVMEECILTLKSCPNRIDQITARVRDDSGQEVAGEGSLQVTRTLFGVQLWRAPKFYGGMVDCLSCRLKKQCVHPSHIVNVIA